MRITCRVAPRNDFSPTRLPYLRQLAGAAIPDDQLPHTPGDWL